MSTTYNLKNVNELAGGDQSFVEILVQTFLEEIPADLESMSSAVANENSLMAYQYAHKMKPNFQLFNIEVQEEIKLIESWSKEEATLEDVAPALKFINTRTLEVLEALRKDFK